MKEVKVIVKKIWRHVGGGYDRSFDGTFRYEKYQQCYKVYCNYMFLHLYLTDNWIDSIHRTFEQNIGDEVEYFDYEDDSEMSNTVVDEALTLQLTKFCLLPWIKLTVGSESECKYSLNTKTFFRAQELSRILDRFLPILEEEYKERFEK